MTEFIDEDVQAAAFRFLESVEDCCVFTTSDMRAALDAALASALKREAASVPQDEVEIVLHALSDATHSDEGPTFDEARSAIAAIDAHRAKHAKPVAITLNASQLAQALEFAAPDRPTDSDQVMTEVCIGHLPKGKDADGNDCPEGLCCWLSEYPEEGCIDLDPNDSSSFLGNPAPAPQIPEHGKLWSFLRSAMSQGSDIQQDYAHGKFNSYEAYSAHMDAAASTLADELERLLAAAPKPGGDHES